MKRMSIWASTHRTLSWIIITICHIVIYYAAMYIGGLLDRLGLNLTIAFLLTVFFAGIFCFILYPGKSDHTKSYVLRKTCELTLGLSCFLCHCFMYNNNNRVSKFNTYTALQGSFSFSKREVKKDSITPATKMFTKKEIRQEKQNLRKLFYHFQKEQKDDSGGKIFALIGIIILAFLGLTVVAALACSLSCNGAGAAGALIGIVGVVAVIWLAVWGIKKLFRKKPEKEK